MSRGPKLCSVRSCYEARSRHTSRNMCQRHDTEADAEEWETHAADPQRQVEAELDECETVADLKQFISTHLMPG